MDGIHDMGGMHGFGKVEPGAGRAGFPRGLGRPLLRAQPRHGLIGAWTIDEGRAGIEELPPDVYLAQLLLRKWALRLENMRRRLGPCRHRRDRSRSCVAPGKPLTRKLTAADVANTLTARLFRPAGAAAPARFTAGRPGAREEHPSGDPYAPAALCPRPHRRGRGATRLPCFSRHPAIGQGEHPQWLYTVRFEGRELWGDDGRSHARGLDRGFRALSGAGMTRRHDPASLAWQQ